MHFNNNAGKFTAFLAALLFLTGFVAWWLAQAPAPQPGNAPDTVFSAGRAWEHINVMAREPHPASSHANNRVFEYILEQAQALNLEIEIIDGPKANHRGDYVEFGRAILGRIRGTDPTKAFAMDAHFDSVPYGPGAADDLSGIATMLETARVLRTHAPLKNDLIFVFADQEEVGANGAKAFRHHPWFEEVGVMLGLETRGVCGPALMFETSQNNGKLIRELKNSGVSARANSIMFSVYDRLPFGSDFGQYKHHVPGYNVAYIDGFGYYHTRLDNPEKISLASLQHHGEYALGLALHLGNMDLHDFYAPNATFFNLLGSYMVVYPQSWDMPFTALAILTLLAALAVGFKRKAIRGLRFAGALLFTVLAAVLAALPGTLSLIAFLLYRECSLYQNTLYCLGIIVMGLGILFLLYGLVRKALRPTELLAGTLFGWILLLYPAHVWLAGGAHIAIWPLLIGSLLLLALSLLHKEEKEWQSRTIFLLTLPLIPVLAALVPLLQMLSFTLTPLGAFLINVLSVLIVGLFALQMQLFVQKRFLIPGGIIVLAGLVFFSWGLQANRPDADNPRLNCLAYAHNFDTEESWWLSSDRNTREWFKDVVGFELPGGLFENESPLDEWTSQFFPDTTREAIPEFRRGDKRPYLKAAAPAPDFAPFTMKIEEDRLEGDTRKVIMRITSPQLAGDINLRKISDGPVHSAALEDQPLRTAEKNWHLHLNYLPEEGAKLHLEVDPEDELRFHVREESWVLPVFEQYKPRPAHLAAEPNRVLDFYVRLHSEHCFTIATVTPEEMALTQRPLEPQMHTDQH
ncbi:MAG: M20/M25/M40 family metallo-hydrolase [Candidatus Hydrogenedens sp.]|jgi:hypothetical protein|nr:M20/M25/M40 family metallo-hydrolase [Candidatus Hydrogenedens sp.]